MLEVPVYNTEGKKIDAVEVDEALFGEATEDRREHLDQCKVTQ